MSGRIPAGRVIALLLILLFNPGWVNASEADQIQSLIAKGELRQALALTDKELLRDEQSVTFRFLKGLILTRLDELDKASNVFLELTREHPDLPEPYNNLAVIYASQGDFDKARDALKQAISTHPTYATAHENMGDIYAKMASKAYNQALQLDADNSSAKAKLALVNDLFFVPKNENDSMELLAKADEEAKKAAEAHEKAVKAAQEEAEAAKRELAMLKERQVQEEKERVAREKADREKADRAKAEEIAKEKARLEAAAAEKVRQAEERRKAAEARAEQEASARAEQEAKAKAEQEARARAEQEAKARAEQEAMQVAQNNDQEKSQRDEQNKAAIIDTVNSWAASWSAQDAEAYIAFYGREFSPPKKLTREAWEAQRKVRLAKPRFIKVSLNDIRVSLLGDAHAQASFQQKYESNTYRDSVKKTLILKKENGNWLITGEHSD